MDIDLNEAKYVKINLITVKGRENSMINELCRETVVSYVTLKVQDFLKENVDLLHSLPL
jgi:septin family protein